ncbi:DNA internalization-related competence protein ComEC/Rec2 [Grimontia sp. NTOU-MAR1]|uniref:DNA internalization-related competence protein ComEC/Rec2 n=1 Tax=Grimontia sp. NTOU-MAR1 TaxID=3111011 RepID=UPI002DB9BAD0|nr:DNA internalization-related competence protein ComEC/Rec2 [Grimontia sp. NTOU-MAR1]WRV98493.1 DNA internalization-related competence protein ComEC/Rec2 [Grimontia sp. NTOU-MAR1]
MKVMLGIVVAIVSLRWWPALPEPMLLLGLLAVILVQCKRIPLFVIGLTIGCLVASSAATLHLFKTSTALTVLQNTTIAGKVGSLFTGENQQTSVIFDVDTVNGRKLSAFEKFRARFYWRSEFPVKQGQQWELTVRLREPYGRVNEAGFDAETYFLSKHIHAKGSVLSAKLVDEGISARQWLFDRNLPQILPFENSAFLVALAFGERAFLDSQNWIALRNTGLAHLLAISGLHIGLAFFFGYRVTKGLLPMLTPSDRYLWISVLVGLVFAVSYAWLAGFSLTAQRAVIALIVFMCIRLSGFGVSPFNTLLLVLGIVLLTDPLSVFSVSFWLSFGAVMVLCVMTLTTRGGDSKGAVNYLFQLFRMQCYLLVGMLPLMWAWFGGVSFLSLVCNLLAVPIVSLVTVPMILLSLLSSLLFSNAWLWRLADYSLWPVRQMLNHADIGWLDVHGVSILFVFVLVLTFYLMTRLKFARIRVLSIVLVLTLLGWRGPMQREDGWQVDVLDVGHGLAVLVEKNGEAILYDTGAAWSSGSIAQSVIEPILSARNSKLAGLIISHGDNDHSGGKDWVIENLSPDWVRTPETGSGYIPCIQGANWQWQSLTFEVLYPIVLINDAENEDSCVVRISDGRYSVLLTGDLPKEQENELIEQGLGIGADVLLVPHHGSKTSSSPEFIDAVNPSAAIASTGRYTPWSLPNPDVVDRYRERDISWYETGQHGQVGVHFSDKGWRVSSQRLDIDPFWFRKMFGPPPIKE